MRVTFSDRLVSTYSGHSGLGLRCLSWRIPNPRCIAGPPPFIATIIHPPFAMDDVNTLKTKGPSARPDGIPRRLARHAVMGAPPRAIRAQTDATSLVLLGNRLYPGQPRDDAVETAS
jgi:hypothetical protein